MSKAVLEKHIEQDILEYLSYLPECYAWKNHSTGIYDPTRKVFRKNKNKHVIKGASDILGIYQGLFLAIEVKTPKRRSSVTIEQRAFLDQIAAFDMHIL